jgi:hypothetical protein
MTCTGSVSADFYHTVGVKTDDTMLAVGASCPEGEGERGEGGGGGKDKGLRGEQPFIEPAAAAARPENIRPTERKAGSRRRALRAEPATA